MFSEMSCKVIMTKVPEAIKHKQQNEKEKEISFKLCESSELTQAMQKKQKYIQLSHL